MDVSRLTYEQIGAWADILSHSGREAEATQLLRQGLKRARGDVGDAGALFAKFNGSRPDGAELSGDFETCRQSLKQDPQNPLLMRDMAVALSLLGRMEEAIEYFDRALAAQSGAEKEQGTKSQARADGSGLGATPDFVRSRLMREEPGGDWASSIPDILRFPQKATDGNRKFRTETKRNTGDICMRIIDAFKGDQKRILKTIAENEEKFKALTSARRSIPEGSFSLFSVLRKWNSYTPILPSEKGDNQGGGYFLYIQGKQGKPGRGIVIDPGFNFVENFYEEGFKGADIDAVLISHAHNDHTVDLETILTLVHRINTGRCKKSRKKIDLFLNLGAFQKYSGWLNIQGSGMVDDVKVLHAGNTYDLSREYNGLKIHAIKAEHDEVITDKYSLGFVLEVDGCTIALTGDTGWKMDKSVAAPYNRHEIGLMVAHLGSIKKSEFDYIKKKTVEEKQKCLYEQHLGILGVGAMLDSVRPRLAVISEFGEELKPLRKEVVEKFDEVLGATRCIPGEVGLHIRIPDLSVYCIVHRDFVPYDEIRIFGRPDQSHLYYHKDPAEKRDTAEIHDLARELAQRERAVSIFERLKRGPVRIR